MTLDIRAEAEKIIRRAVEHPTSKSVDEIESLCRKVREEAFEKGRHRGLNEAARHLRRWHDINYNDRARDILSLKSRNERSSK